MTNDLKRRANGIMREGYTRSSWGLGKSSRCFREPRGGTGAAMRGGANTCVLTETSEQHRYAAPTPIAEPPIQRRYVSMETKYVNTTTNVRISSTPKLSHAVRCAGSDSTAAPGVGSVTLRNNTRISMSNKTVFILSTAHSIFITLIRTFASKFIRPTLMKPLLEWWTVEHICTSLNPAEEYEASRTKGVPLNCVSVYLIGIGTLAVGVFAFLM